MSAVPGTIAERYNELRESFDRSFALPPRQQVGEYCDLLAIRVEGHRYALRLGEAAGLFPDRPVTALPGPQPALLGVAGFRGSIVPVYRLGAVLGHPPCDPPRWLALVSGTPAVALAFQCLDGHARVPDADIIDEVDGAGQGRCLRGMAALADGTRPIVDLPAVRAVIRSWTGNGHHPGSGIT